MNKLKVIVALISTLITTTLSQDIEIPCNYVDSTFNSIMEYTEYERYINRGWFGEFDSTLLAFDSLYATTLFTDSLFREQCIVINHARRRVGLSDGNGNNVDYSSIMSDSLYNAYDQYETKRNIGLITLGTGYGVAGIGGGIALLEFLFSSISGGNYVEDKDGNMYNTYDPVGGKIAIVGASIAVIGIPILIINKRRNGPSISYRQYIRNHNILTANNYLNLDCHYEYPSYE